MRNAALALVIVTACGARTTLDDGARPIVDAHVDAFADAANDDVGSDAPLADVGPPAICGNGVVESGEQCDLGPDNGDKPAFLVTQPSGTHIETNMLFQKKSAVQFYDYFSASSHTGFEVAEESRLYLYADATTGRLSLILTHGIDAGQGQTQPNAAVNMTIAGLPSGWNIDLSDDPGELTKSSATTATGKWTFQNNSDGGVIGGLPFPGTWTITVDATFVKGVNAWAWVRHDLTRVPLAMGDTVTIRAFDESSFCRTNCTIPKCGDGILDGGEVCDDGNTIDGDGCAGDCKHFD
jgi:cysteine-rich repeat protein